MNKQQYQSRALELAQMPVGGDIDGYMTEEGQIVRYDRKTNDFVKGHPGVGIATMFKPKDKEKYFEDHKNKEEKK